MDVAPEWYQDWERASCANPTRRCGGGDQVCADDAVRDGYVRISNYDFCPAGDVRHGPGVTAYYAIVLGLGVVFVAGFMWSRRSRTRPKRRA